LTSAVVDEIGLRPVFISALLAVTRPAWSGPIWKPNSGTDLEPGSFVFTPGGDFLGLVIDDASGPAIVGGDVLAAEIDRLRKRPPSDPGQLGIEVQPLTPSLAHATGSAGGVVVTWVDPRGPAARLIFAGDVIEEVNGERLTADYWAVRASRIASGETVTLRVRRGEMREVAIVAHALNPPTVAGLGLTMRALAGIGSEVVYVVPFAAAQRSGLEPGDVITLAGETPAPTPDQIRAAYGAQRTGRGGVLVTLVRGNTHRVIVLEP
jgi:S1-C subfamily serine protease